MAVIWATPHAPTSNTASHNNHEKIHSWVSASFTWGYAWRSFGKKLTETRFFATWLLTEVDKFIWIISYILQASKNPCTRPWAIPLATITMRKSIHGFPFLSYEVPLRDPPGRRSFAKNLAETRFFVTWLLIEVDKFWKKSWNYRPSQKILCILVLDSFNKQRLICAATQTSQGRYSNTTNTEKYTVSLYKGHICSNVFPHILDFPFTRKRSDQLINECLVLYKENRQCVGARAKYYFGCNVARLQISTDRHSRHWLSNMTSLLALRTGQFVGVFLHSESSTTSVLNEEQVVPYWDHNDVTVRKRKSCSPVGWNLTCTHLYSTHCKIHKLSNEPRYL